VLAINNLRKEKGGRKAGERREKGGRKAGERRKRS
jgi:hypothetical protein